jgi:virginiamycin B lyase
VDGGVWYTAQHSGELGWLDPATGDTRHIDLGNGSAPHGVIVDAGGMPWITDSGLNAILSVDPITEQVTSYPMPDDAPDANLNTAAFDGDGTLWFTGQNGFYGFVVPGTGEVGLFPAPEGRGPYGITATPGGTIYYASLAGSHIARIEPDGEASVIEPPTPEQGARRVWSDSNGGIWVSEWNAGSLSRYVPEDGTWDIFPLPGAGAQAYAVYVDEHDMVWASDFGSNSMVRLDPATGVFDVFPLPHEPGNVRQILGRSGEVWAAESAADSLLLIGERRP